MELEELGLLDGLQRISGGQLSSEELTTACLESIKRLDSQVNAWEWLDHQAALDAACEADIQVASGGTLGALHGLPIGVKDIMLTRGIPTCMGSPIYKGNVPTESATVVRHIIGAGGFVMGKTVTTEFAWRNPGKTHNPWNPEYTPGGSSSGSAAAVAAGMVPAALGTQTVGSVIRPAAYCGVVGFKPSFGLISRAGINPLSHSLDHVGIFARSLDDAAYLASCLVGHDSNDLGSLSESTFETFSLKAVAGETCSGPFRLAAVRSPVWSLADRYQQEIWEANVDTLVTAGAEVERVELPPSFLNALDVLRTILFAEGAQIYEPLQMAHPGKTSSAIDTLIEEGKKISALDYLSALVAAKEMRAELQVFLSRFDAIVTPPATGEAPKTLADTGDPSFCGIWTLMGVPAVTFPVGRGPSGLPMGIQLVGAYLDDQKTLDIATWCNRHIGVRLRL